MQLRGLLPPDYDERKRKLPKRKDKLVRRTASPPTERRFKKAVRTLKTLPKIDKKNEFYGPYDDLGDLMEHTSLVSFSHELF